MHVLVLGSNGLLGSNVVTSAQNRNWTVSATYHSSCPSFDLPRYQLDIRDTDGVREVIAETKPDLVVNCAAMTDVDGCEKYPEIAREINARAPGEIAGVCAERGIRFLHVSTDYVFDGMTTGKYREEAQTNPLQVYGTSKRAGERVVEESAVDALIVRVSFLYGIKRSTGQLTGFPAWVQRRLNDGERTPLFTDQNVTPTRAGQAADVLCDLLDSGVSGTFHVASRSCVTPYEFGMRLVQLLNADSALLSEGSQKDVEREAERPSNTCLDVSRLERTLDRRQPTLKDDLESISWAFNADSCA